MLESRTARCASSQEGSARPSGARRLRPVGSSGAGSHPGRGGSEPLRARPPGARQAPAAGSRGPLRASFARADWRWPFFSCALTDQKGPLPQLLASAPRPVPPQPPPPVARGRRDRPRRLPRRRRGSGPTPPCGRGGLLAALGTRRRQLTHPAARSRAASRVGRRAPGPRDRAPPSWGTGGAWAECACVRACVRTCAPRPPEWRGGGRPELWAPPPPGSQVVTV